MRALELKIPPPALVILTATLMWLISRPAFDFVLPGRRGITIGLVIAGFVIIAVGVITFRRAGTTVNPLKPETAGSLVMSGIYRRTRNPMYLGMLLGLVGWAVFLSNALAFLCLPVFVLYLTRFQIRPEERALTALFGNDFTAYQSKVRRWL